jgi:hypothetical protein
VGGFEKEQAAAGARTTEKGKRAGWGGVYIPTLATIKPSRRWGTQTFLAGFRKDNSKSKSNSNSNGNSNGNSNSNSNGNGNGGCLSAAVGV